MNVQTIMIIGGVALVITATIGVIALLKAQKTKKDLEDFVKLAHERGWIKVEPAQASATTAEQPAAAKKA